MQTVVFTCMLCCLLMVFDGQTQTLIQPGSPGYSFYHPSKDKESWQRLNLLLSSTFIVVAKEGQIEHDTCLYIASRSLGLSRFPVILVGHSMGGMVVTAVAEKIPAKISKLVYIGAFLPANGQALTDLAFSDPDSRLGPLLIPSADKLTLDVKCDSLTWLFINDGSQVEKQKLANNYRAEPAIPFTSKVTVTNENFGSVSKVYIKTLHDVVISPGLQDKMIAAAGITTVYEVNTSHSPFLSQPKAVADLLIKIGQ